MLPVRVCQDGGVERVSGVSVADLVVCLLDLDFAGAVADAENLYVSSVSLCDQDARGAVRTVEVDFFYVVHCGV